MKIIGRPMEVAGSGGQELIQECIVGPFHLLFCITRHPGDWALSCTSHGYVIYYEPFPDYQSARLKLEDVLVSACERAEKLYKESIALLKA